MKITRNQLKKIVLEELKKSTMNEAKADYVASFKTKQGNMIINIKNGNNLASDDELSDLYTKLGKLIDKSNLPVTDITIKTKKIK